MQALAFTVMLAAPRAVPPATAQATVREAIGPSRCVRCHAKEWAWWEKTDGPPPRGHVNALRQLESPEARRYAARLGVADAFAANGSCVACHATVFRGEAREGVSCESCHGPGAGYLDVHAQPGAYRLAVSAGMLDTVGNAGAWARRCLDCHRIADRRLLAAGHSSGRTFDLSKAYEVVSRHWKRRYTREAVAAAARDIEPAAAPQRHGR